MIAAWMLYGLTVGALLGLAACLLDRAVRIAGGPTRLVWSVAMLLATAVPIGALALGDRMPGLGLGLLRPEWSTDGLAGAWSLAAPALSAADRIGWLDGALVSLWGCATAGLLARLGQARFRLRRERARWRPAVVDSVPVLLSPRLGPATIGALRVEIVLPEAVVDLPAPHRRMILRHELEHVRARDGLLTMVGFGLVALIPWNPMLWWMLDRLRHAQEVDCDRRVLAAGAPVRDYVDLLVTSGRTVEVGLAGGPGFAVRRSCLCRRVNEILRPVPRLRRLKVLGIALPGFMVLGLGLLAAPPVGGAPHAGGSRSVETGADAMLREFAARLGAPAGPRGSGTLDLDAARAAMRRIEARLSEGGMSRVAIDRTLRAAERLVRDRAGAGSRSP